MPRPKMRHQTGKTLSVKKAKPSKAKSSTNVDVISSAKKKLKKTPKKRKQLSPQSEDESNAKWRHHETDEETGSEVDSDGVNEEDSHNREASNDSECVSVSCSVVSIAVSSVDLSCIERNSSVYSKHIVKVSQLFEEYDAKLISLNYRLVEHQIKFSKLYSKIKSFMLLKKQSVKPKQSKKRTSWEYMFERWLAYARKYPNKKNSVSINHDAKLNNLVKEQQRAFSKYNIKHDVFMKLHNEGFNFQPRKLEEEKKRKVNASVGDMTWTAAAVGKSSSTHVLDAVPNSAPVVMKTTSNNVKAVKPSATAPPLEVSPTVPPTDALPSSSHSPTQGNIGVKTPHILPTRDNIGLNSQAENQCKVGVAVPTSVDLGDVGITDEVLHAAADLGTEQETTTTVPPTEALPISSTLPTQGNIHVNLPPILPTGDNISFSSQVHNQSEVGSGTNRQGRRSH